MLALENEAGHKNGCSYWHSCTNRKPFYHHSDKDFLFEKIFENPELKVEDVTSEYDHETLALSITGKNMQCLDNLVNVKHIIPKNSLIIRRPLHLQHQMNLNQLMPNRNECVEYQVKLDVSYIKNKEVWSGLFNSTMTVGLPRVEDGKIKFDIIEDVYKKCKANLFINCTSRDGNVAVFKNLGLKVEQSRVQGLLC